MRGKKPKQKVVFTRYDYDPKTFFRRAVTSPMNVVDQFDLWRALAALEESAYGAVA